MASQLFAVVNTRGPAWNDAAAMEDQVGWRGHADFMNALTAEGFVLLGGPLVGTRDVLMIVRAGSEAEVEARLAVDCWRAEGLLRLLHIRPWCLRLGSLLPAERLRPSVAADAQALTLGGQPTTFTLPFTEREAPSCNNRNAT